MLQVMGQEAGRGWGTSAVRLVSWPGSGGGGGPRSLGAVTAD